MSLQYCDLRHSLRTPKESPWKRRPNPPRCHGFGYSTLTFKRHGLVEPFVYQTPANADVDIDVKKATLLVSSSVVALVASIDGKPVFGASGSIIECVQDSNDGFLSTVLTSASLLTFTSSLNDINIEVHLFDQRIYEGSVYAYDPHFNLAFIQIHSHTPLSLATIRLIDDSIDINPNSVRCNVKRSSLRHSSNDQFPISPGQTVIAIGRTSTTKSVMIAPGELSLDYCELDCKELIRTTCLITKCGVGGPLINCYGEVIGVNFYDGRCTPFLPINIVLKCLEHYRKYQRFCRPWIGMECTNLYVAPTPILEHVIHNFPNIIKGVFIEKIIQGSPADSGGLLEDDIIVQIDGNPISSFLEFFGRLMDKVDETVELIVIRKGTGYSFMLRLAVCENSPENFNSWPLPEEHIVRTQV